jgi:hypothetical protein
MYLAKMILALALCGSCLSPAVAVANSAAAAQCRLVLAPEAALIYDTVLPIVTPTTVIRDVMPEQVRALVIAGRVNESTARESAEAAGECLRVLRQ